MSFLLPRNDLTANKIKSGKLRMQLAYLARSTEEAEFFLEEVQRRQAMFERTLRQTNSHAFIPEHAALESVLRDVTFRYLTVASKVQKETT